MTLDAAYAACAHLARTHYENFPVASHLLPRRMRPHVAAVYAFARLADDIADEGDASLDVRNARLDEWLMRLDAAVQGLSPSASTVLEPAMAAMAPAVFMALGATMRECALPPALFEDLVSAFRQDTTVTRYATWPDLLDYCRRSANPVGRLLLHLFKRTTESNFRQSDAICSALQLINHWQDVDIDYTRDNRVYLPQDEMARFGVSEKHLSDKVCDAAWRDLMKFQVDRARSLMVSGSGLGKSLPGRIGLEIRATVQGGLRILEKIERVGYDVFRRRPVLRPYDWPVLLLKAI